MKKILSLIISLSLISSVALAAETCVNTQDDYRLTCDGNFGCKVKLWYGSTYAKALDPIRDKFNHFWSLRWLPTFVSHGTRLFGEWEIESGQTETVNWHEGYSAEMCEIFPTIIIDNIDSIEGFFRITGEDWSYEVHECGYNGDYYEGITNNTLTAKWTPNVERPGDYEVYVHYCVHSTRSDVTYRIVYSGGETLASVNQTTDVAGVVGDFIPSGWVYLGTFNFEIGTSGFIELVLPSPANVAADAIKLVGVV